MFINLITQMLCAIKKCEGGQRDENGREIGELLPTSIKAKKFNRCQAQIEIRMPKQLKFKYKCSEHRERERKRDREGGSGTGAT